MEPRTTVEEGEGSQQGAHQAKSTPRTPQQNWELILNVAFQKFSLKSAIHTQEAA